MRLSDSQKTLLSKAIEAELAYTKKVRNLGGSGHSAVISGKVKKTIAGASTRNTIGAYEMKSSIKYTLFVENHYNLFRKVVVFFHTRSSDQLRE